MKVTPEGIRHWIEDAKKSGATSLDALDFGLRDFPLEICQISTLKRLNLSSNHLTSLPAEIAELTNLEELILRGNRLTSLPTELRNLRNLETLDLSNNRFTTFPIETVSIERLSSINVAYNKLSCLPKEIGDLTNLRMLFAYNNELGKLPPEIGTLRKLDLLSLHDNKLLELPPEIGHLTSLRELYAPGNRLSGLPEELFNLCELLVLSLHDNELTSISSSIRLLTALKELNVSSNRLVSLPHEIGNLTNLRELYSDNNEFTTLPPSLGTISTLRSLTFDSQKSIMPPAEIACQDTSTILAYLRAICSGTRREWVSKLILLGEGKVGKTSLVAALLEEPFVSDRPQTHGISIRNVVLSHPSESGVDMRLRTWDFGGQEIYHATHQFFLSNRSLFLLLWHCRIGHEASKIYYWLDMIQAKAPNAPIILVATHSEGHLPDLPLQELKRRYPQIVESCSVDSETGEGIEKLRGMLQQHAADLPLMGEQWPKSWVEATARMRALKEHRKAVTPSELFEAFALEGRGQAQVLARWLHELGELLYFQDDPELDDLVILDPQWVSTCVSRILDDKTLHARDGVLTRADVTRLWEDLDPGLRRHFVRLMERFDLSYRTAGDDFTSIVVEAVPFDEANYGEVWDSHGPEEIRMRFNLNTTLPPGIPTWFIAREHRFSTNRHWRHGALFQDLEKKHLALIRAQPHERYVELAVRGPLPQNYFATLRAGLEVVLARYPGLRIDRLVPCNCHAKGEEPCPHYYQLEDLERRLEQNPPRNTVECPKSWKTVDVRALLFGIHPTTIEDVKREIEEFRTHSEDRHEELVQIVQRNFLQEFERDRSMADTPCPRVFAIRPAKGGAWREKVVGQEIELQLYCEAPGCWHPVEGAKYKLKLEGEWLKAIAPHLSKLVKALKYAVPIAAPAAGEFAKDLSKVIADDLKFAEALTKALPDIAKDPDGAAYRNLFSENDPHIASGATLRALQSVLEKQSTEWGGLTRVLTPEHHYLWLCPEHAAEYLPRPMQTP